MNDAITRAKILREKLTSDGNSPFVAAIFSDAHLHTTDEAQFLSLLDAIRESESELGLDALINLGDNFAMLGRERQASNEEIASMLREIHVKLAETTSAPLLSINGNHDGMGTDFFKPELWNESVGSDFEKGTAIHPSGKPYFYSDIDEYKLRLIFLSTPYDSDIDADMPTPLWRFGAEQLDSLENELLQLPDAYRAIILSHVPATCIYNGNPDSTLEIFTGTRKARSKIADLCGWLDDRARFESIVADFTAKGGQVLAAISGHEHFDELYAPGQLIDGRVNRLPCAQILIPSAQTRYNGRLRGVEKYGVSLDIMIVGHDEIHFIRLGDGEDRIIKI